MVCFFPSNKSGSEELKATQSFLPPQRSFISWKEGNQGLAFLHSQARKHFSSTISLSKNSFAKTWRPASKSLHLSSLCNNFTDGWDFCMPHTIVRHKPGQHHSSRHLLLMGQCTQSRRYLRVMLCCECWVLGSSMAHRCSGNHSEFAYAYI